MPTAHAHDDDEARGRCPDCGDRHEIEIIDCESFDGCIGEPSRIDVERVCIGDAKYVGIRMVTVEDPAEACAYIIRNDGQNSVGILWHAATVRQIAAALLNAADLSDGLPAFTVPDTLEGLDEL